MTFNSVTGDIIDGYINVVHDDLQWGYSLVICKIIDQYGNVLLQTKTKDTDNGEQSIQSYPWGFSFLATTGGEYKIEVSTDCMVWNKDLAIIAALQDKIPEPTLITVNIAFAVTHEEN